MGATMQPGRRGGGGPDHLRSGSPERYSWLVDDLPGQSPLNNDSAADAFDEALEAAIARLPDAYRAQLATVAIVVADEATPEELALVGAPGLYGLYRGVPRTAFGADNVPIPSVITLYRGPLERRWRGPVALVHGVEETLRHELAHHLGISDARLDELHDGG
jgi:predicted Zn-dependent protease with MMP-like domain